MVTFPSPSTRISDDDDDLSLVSLVSSDDDDVVVVRRPPPATTRFSRRNHGNRSHIAAESSRGVDVRIVTIAAGGVAVALTVVGSTTLEESIGILYVGRE